MVQCTSLLCASISWSYASATLSVAVRAFSSASETAGPGTGEWAPDDG